MNSIRSVMRVSLFLSSLLLLACMARNAAAAEGGAKGALDGRAFIIENGKKGGSDRGRDVYLFHGGTFRSTLLEKWDGFHEGAYTSARNQGVIAFAADTDSRSRGTIHWEGTVTGDRIDVRYTWTDAPRWYRSRPTPTEYRAQGEEVKRPDKEPGERTGASSHLDGKTFYVRTGEKGKEADHADYMIYRDGTFVSSGCVEQQFGKTVYQASRDGDGIRFRASTTSPTHGVMIWEGTVRDDVMEATARWIHDRWYWKIDREYWYRGRIVP